MTVAPMASSDAANHIDSSHPRIAAIVCTYNRADRLALCLASLKAQSLAAVDYEVIVVDDGSTDRTAAVCVEFAHLPNLRTILQPNAGLGAARERGWRAARAPVIAFLDDDAIAPPTWLEAILRRFDGPSAPAVLGGPTKPIWESVRPLWLDDSLAVWLTVWSPFNDYRESREEPLFVGANMTFQRAALARAGGFSHGLGRRGAQLLSHEESDIWERLRMHGFRSAYDPAVWVQHFVPATRLKRAWFRRRIFWEGVSMTRRHRPPGDGRRLLRALRLALSSLAPGAHGFGSFKWQLHVAYQCGRAREWCRTCSTS